MKKLMTNGCSMTKGVYDNFNEHDAWPWQLASLIDMDLDQLAESGSSNARIFRTTMEYLLENTPDYAIIAWTEPYRFELPYYTGDTIRIMPHIAVPDLDESIHDLPKLRKFWYKYCNNSVTAIERTVSYIRLLEMVFKDKGIPYKMCWGLHCDYVQEGQGQYSISKDKFPSDKTQRLDAEIAKIQTEHWMMWDSSMQVYLQDYPKADEWGHHNKLGHTEWATQMYRTINETLRTTR
jgi:hypothetical protein